LLPTDFAPSDSSAVTLPVTGQFKLSGASSEAQQKSTKKLFETGAKPTVTEAKPSFSSASSVPLDSTAPAAAAYSTPLSSTNYLFRLVDELKGLKANELNISLIHLYRGELSKAVVYRRRLDQTCNWAITISSAMMGFSFSNHTLPHWVYAVILFQVIVFLVLDTRRYAVYQACKQRVRIMELGYYCGVILPACWTPSTAETSQRQRAEAIPETIGWERRLHDVLVRGRSPLSFWHAAVLRFRRVYAWIMLSVLIGWHVKMYVEDALDARWIVPVWVVFVTSLAPMPFIYRTNEIDV